jgi:capsular exopolysaccharide synthesis family protein
MTLQDVLKVLRTRWVMVVAMTVIGVLGAVVMILMTTPIYQATTRLFVSTSAGVSATDLYQGNRLSQDRVLSYTDLIMGQTLAQRTIDKLGLNMDPNTLRENVKATARPETVLLNVNVRDESPLRARDIANAMSDEFVTMVSELETPPGGATPNARVVVEQRAALPDRPVVPRKTRTLAFGAALGLLLGITAALLRDTLDNTVKSPDTAGRSAGVGVVGSIPLDKIRRTEPAIVFSNDHSAIAESFRKLRTNLQFLSVDNPPRVIVITSSLPGEGKSTTAINIALALAEAGNNVLLVDGDLRRPTMHKYLDVVGSVGFSTVLSGAITLSEALQKTRFDGLTVLSAGATPPNPSELLGSRAAKTLMDKLRAEFDYVVVDSSPLLAVTDAAILAASADGVLMIVRFGTTKRDQLTHAVQNLADVGREPLGVVIAMTPKRGESSYSYNYSYYGDGDTRAKRSSRK